LAAAPRHDSVELTATGRSAAAAAAFYGRAQVLARMHPVVGRGAAVVLLDDIVTTGSTLAACALILRRHGVSVASAAVLAATRRRDRAQTNVVDNRG
jgi:predicted amidophosphoribosyltransferase